ncbi:hypothetical protein BRD03_13465 [Halobacteriales archaeon QS_9_68_17]|nr:MAG: hypothetical protein BRD03_13465 [Halobacteriales archaeon QS_9_68_17]
MTTPGLHHVSVIAGDPQANADFYVDTLGLHSVTRTVDFDEKFMYHLYYGDAAGTPGTLLTFSRSSAPRRGDSASPSPGRRRSRSPKGPPRTGTTVRFAGRGRPDRAVRRDGRRLPRPRRRPPRTRHRGLAAPANHRRVRPGAARDPRLPRRHAPLGERPSHRQRWRFQVTT